MTPEQLQIMLAVLALALEYGVPAVTNALAAYGKETITLEDIQALRDLVKPPEAY